MHRHASHCFTKGHPMPTETVRQRALSIVAPLALRRVRVTTMVLLAAVVGAQSRAEAGCNLIPGTAKTFNAELGATNRPYAAPGEPLEIALRQCDPTALTANA